MPQFHLAGKEQKVLYPPISFFSFSSFLYEAFINFHHKIFPLPESTLNRKPNKNISCWLVRTLISMSQNNSNLRIIEGELVSNSFFSLLTSHATLSCSRHPWIRTSAWLAFPSYSQSASCNCSGSSSSGWRWPPQRPLSSGTGRWRTRTLRCGSCRDPEKPLVLINFDLR